MQGSNQHNLRNDEVSFGLSPDVSPGVPTPTPVHGTPLDCSDCRTLAASQPRAPAAEPAPHFCSGVPCTSLCAQAPGTRARSPGGAPETRLTPSQPRELTGPRAPTSGSGRLRRTPGGRLLGAWPPCGGCSPSQVLRQGSLWPWDLPGDGGTRAMSVPPWPHWRALRCR